MSFDAANWTRDPTTTDNLVIDEGYGKSVKKFESQGFTRDDFDLLSVFHQKKDKTYYRFTTINRSKPLVCIYETIINVQEGWPRNGEMIVEKEREVANENKELAKNDVNYPKVKEIVDGFYGKSVDIPKVHVYETELGFYYVVEVNGVQGKYNLVFLEKTSGELFFRNFI